jgi:hypothetical protein|tara:strand:- start:899 stop:1069 length:171 start_codon:yes stop_codon:yes gene_type:complete
MSKAGHEYFSWKNEIECNILREMDLKTLILKKLGFKQSNQLRIKQIENEKREVSLC